MDHSLSNPAPSLGKQRTPRTITASEDAPHRRCLPASVDDGELNSFISLLYLLSQSMLVPDEGAIYLKWPITAREAKRLDENPILSHNHQTEFGLH